MLLIHPTPTQLSTFLSEHIPRLAVTNSGSSLFPLAFSCIPTGISPSSHSGFLSHFHTFLCVVSGIRMFFPSFIHLQFTFKPLLVGPLCWGALYDPLASTFSQRGHQLCARPSIPWSLSPSTLPGKFCTSSSQDRLIFWCQPNCLSHPAYSRAPTPLCPPPQSCLFPFLCVLEI